MIEMTLLYPEIPLNFAILFSALLSDFPNNPRIRESRVAQKSLIFVTQFSPVLFFEKKVWMLANFQVFKQSFLVYWKRKKKRIQAFNRKNFWIKNCGLSHFSPSTEASGPSAEGEHLITPKIFLAVVVALEKLVEDYFLFNLAGTPTTTDWDCGGCGGHPLLFCAEKNKLIWMAPHFPVCLEYLNYVKICAEKKEKISQGGPSVSSLYLPGGKWLESRKIGFKFFRNQIWDSKNNRMKTEVLNVWAIPTPGEMVWSNIVTTPTPESSNTRRDGLEQLLRSRCRWDLVDSLVSTPNEWKYANFWAQKLLFLLECILKSAQFTPLFWSIIIKSHVEPRGITWNHV